jgi:hypothetical protein
VIVAGAVFGGRSIDFVGEPQWIVAGIFGTGHSCMRAPRPVNVGPLDEPRIFNFVINKNAIAIFSTTIAFLDNLPPSPPAEQTTARQASAPVLKRLATAHTTTGLGALAASCIAASCIRQRRPAPHVSGQIGLRHKASIAARGASDHNPYQGVLQTMALRAAHHMSYRS